MKVASPLYVFPGPKWDSYFLDRKPSLIVANPASGPGEYSSTYDKYLVTTKQLGIVRYGYVDCDYMNIPIATILSNVDKWRNLYTTSPIDGIFLDEYDRSGTVASYDRARTLYTSIKSRGLKVIVNPGTKLDANYLPYFDIAMSFEGTAKDYLISTRPDWERNSAYQNKVWHCVHTCDVAQLPLVCAKMAATSPGGYLWITPDTMSNPYDTVHPVEYYNAIKAIPEPVVPAPTPTVTGTVTLDLVVNGLPVSRKVTL